MRPLPTGAVTLLFTDIEGSTRLLDQLGDRYAAALADHRAVLRAAFDRHGGIEVDTQGDAFFAAFPTASGAVSAATEAQRDMGPTGIRVRIGIHTGTPTLSDEGYVGMDVHRGARIAATAHGGQVILSRATRDALDASAVELRDMGEHRLKDLPQPEWLFQLLVPGLPTEFPPLKSLSTTNLPMPARRLIGRDEELAALCRLLAPGGGRVVTVTGTGGTGKTRLAVQAGLDLLEQFRNGVLFVALAPLSEADQVVPAIADVLGVREQPGEPLLASVIAHLEPRRTLLVLDNFEHVGAAAPAVAEITRGAAGLTVLCTSREPLRIADERELPLLPLAPRDAAELFAEHAGVAGTTADDPAVEEICRRLDGLPLAVELAAARARMLPPQAMLRRMDRALPVLTSGGRDLPARQQTLRATLEWSYRLLDEDERRAFRRLSVFAGGATLDAIEAALGPDARPIESLLEKSLLRRRVDDDGEPRFWMLQTVREYAEEQLAAHGEAREAGRGHAEWTAALAEAAAPHLLGRQQATWLDRLEQEEGNVRFAVSESLARGDAVLALRISAALIDFWDARGRYREVRSWLEQGLDELGAKDTDLAARSLLALGFARLQGGDVDGARAATEQSASVFEQLGDARLLSRALSQLAGIAIMDGRLDEAAGRAERAAALAREAADDAMLGFALNALAIAVHELGDTDRAQELFQEAVDRLRAAGDRRSVALLIGNLGTVALLNGDYSAALDALRSSLALSQELGDRGRLAAQHYDLALAALMSGAAEECSSHLLVALADAREGGDVATQIFSVHLAAAVCAARGDDRPAARLHAAAMAAAAEAGLRQTGSEELTEQTHIVPARHRLGEAAWLVASADGGSLPIEDAVDRAMEAVAAAPVRARA
jgi:predicted ATPase/class 3 adenylate cyclase